MSFGAITYAADTELGEHMEELNDAYKALRKTNDAEEGVTLTREAQVKILKALEFGPEMLKDMPDGKDKDKALADYGRLIASTYATFCAVEIAFLDDDLDKVQELVKDLKAFKKEGHKAYIDDN